MSCFGDDVVNGWLDDLLGSGAPANIYFALMLAASSPGTGVGGTEASAGGYARASLTNNATNFPSAAARQKRNATAIDFGTATADVGTDMPTMDLYDALSGGNYLGFVEFSTPVTWVNGAPLVFSANSITFRLPVAC